MLQMLFTILTLMVLLLGDGAVQFLAKLGVKRYTAMTFIGVQAVTALFPLVVQIRMVTLELTAVLLTLIAFFYLLASCTNVWQWYRCVLCACVLATAAFACTMYDPELADGLLLETRWIVSLTILLVACAARLDTASACACVALSAVTIPCAVCAANHLWFGTQIRLDAYPVRLLLLDGLVWMAAFYALGNKARERIQRKKRCSPYPMDERQKCMVFNDAIAGLMPASIPVST